MDESKFMVNSNILTVKVIVAGPGGVGKTTLLKRYETNNYIPAVSTVGINFLVRDIEVGNTVLRIAYWDYAGEDRFRSLFPGYCQGSSGAFLAFDATRLQTISALPEWLRMIRENNKPNIPIILLGNKMDAVPDDTKNLIAESASNFTQEYNLSGYYLCSAKSGEGIEAPFSHLGILINEAYNRENY
ncbi:MAG: Rab family GTPase [Candidatus Hodarchaeales archaeon]